MGVQVFRVKNFGVCNAFSEATDQQETWHSQNALSTAGLNAFIRRTNVSEFLCSGAITKKKFSH